MRFLLSIIVIHLINSIISTMYVHKKIKTITKMHYPFILLINDTLNNFTHPIHTFFILYCIFFLDSEHEEKLNNAIAEEVKKLDE